MASPVDDALRIYLRDHHAGAVAGTALSQRISAGSEGNGLKAEMAAVAADIAADKETLEAVMVVLEIPTSTVKDALAAAGERLMGLKPNGELFAPPALSRLIELEALSAGITGKAALWRSLQTVSAGEPRLQAFEFGVLAATALEQRDRVDACHDSLVAATFPKSA